MIHNAIKYGTALAGAIGRLVGLGDDEEGTVRLGETLTPIIDPWRFPEADFLRRERLGAAQETRNPDAANFSFVGLLNPATSRMIVVVRQVIIPNANAAIANFFIARSRQTVTVLANLALGRPRDTRYLIPGGTVTQSGDGVEAARTADADMIFVRIMIGDTHTLKVDFVLHPGASLIVQPDAINTSVRASFVYHERQAFPGELNSGG